MSKQWQRARKKDHYYKQAKSAGYRSRAAYKLLEIHNKFRIFRPGDTVLDLGAAPGGWSQIAVEKVGETGLVIGVDLETIAPLTGKNVTFIRGDITKPKLVEDLIEILDDRKVNVMISDAAPNISGQYSMDQAKSIYLAENVLKLADEVLNISGKLVLKIFEGEDFPEFIAKVKRRFRKYKIFSPKASRAKSSEVYIIGLGYLKNAVSM